MQINNFANVTVKELNLNNHPLNIIANILLWISHIFLHTMHIPCSLAFLNLS